MRRGSDSSRSLGGPQNTGVPVGAFVTALDLPTFHAQILAVTLAAESVNQAELLRLVNRKQEMQHWEMDGQNLRRAIVWQPRRPRQSFTPALHPHLGKACL